MGGQGLHEVEDEAVPVMTAKDSNNKKSESHVQKRLVFLLTQVRSDSDAGSEESWDGLEEDGEEEVDGSDDEGSDDEPSAHAYQNLLKSLAESAPKTKKRKLESSETDDKPQKQARTEAEGDEDEDDEDDVPKEDPDHVDEPEETQEPAPEDLFDEDDDLDPSDPFESHFSAPDMKAVAPRLSAIQQEDWQIRRINSAPWRLFMNAPYVPEAGDVPLPKAINGPKDLRLKKKLEENVTGRWTEFNDTEKLLAPLVFNHFDTLFCERTISNSASLRRMACLHALNHVFK